MDYVIMTHKGYIFDITIDIKPSDLVAQLNSQSLLTLAFSGMVLHKNNLKTIVPAGDLEGAYQLHAMDGALYLTDIDDYDSQVLSDYINDTYDEFILIGDIIIQRHNFDMVRLVPE